MGHRSRAVAITTGLALLALAALFWLMGQLASRPIPSETPPLDVVSPLSRPAETNTFVPPGVSSNAIPSSNLTLPAEPFVTPAGTVIARVNDAPITQDEWRVALLLDGVMSRLTRQPMPSAEETLQRLINERLLLHAAQLDRVSLPLSEAEARIRQIQHAFGISDQQLDGTLAFDGLRRTDLVRRTARLILVERAIEILHTRHGDLDSWLAQARADSSIVVYPGVSAPPTGEAPSATSFSMDTPIATAQVSGATSTPMERHPTTHDDTPSADESLPLAPDFTLLSAQGTPITLSQYRHRSSVVLVFYRGQT
jgi:hypothetical protein